MKQKPPVVKKKKKEKEKKGTVLEASITLSDLQQVLKDAPPEYVEALAPAIREVVGLFQLATLGNVKSVEELMAKPGPFLQKLLDYDRGAILGFIKARALSHFMTGETKKDPLEWGRLMLELEKLQQTKRLSQEASRFGGSPHGSGPSGEVARYSNPLLQDVEGNGEESGPPGGDSGSK